MIKMKIDLNTSSLSNNVTNIDRQIRLEKEGM